MQDFSRPRPRCIYDGRTCTSCLPGKELTLPIKPSSELLPPMAWHRLTHLLGLRDDIPRLMAALDVLASSSSYGEAFPNVLGEAMASGVPCAVTDVGDSAYIVGDTGRVVSSGDMEGLAHAIGSLLEMPAEALRILGARARARVAEHFEIGKIVRRYEAFYQELASASRNKRR